MLVDTHCHLNFDRFDKDRPQVIQRALDAGVVGILNPGVDLASSREAVNLAESFPQIYAAVGVHPNDTRSWRPGALGDLRRMAAHPKVVAVGEIGLDYYRDRAPRALQQEVFGLQLELAVELDLPVVIHTRDAGEQDRAATRDILAMLSEWIQGLKAQGSPLVDRPGVLHSYSSGAGFASQVFELGFMIGITGPVTFRKADELRQVVAEAPLERLLVETDAPFLTPHPYRGKRNEPAHVRYVVQKIAEIHNLPFEKVAQITSAGAERLFHWQVIK